MIPKSRFLTLLLTIIASSSYLSPARGETIRFGVVRSSDNSKQWQEISDRVKLLGVNYCVLDWSQLKKAEDLSQLSVLLLPNVETVTAEQTQALQAWSQKGGRFIVTGPVGNLSQPQVKEQLRSLFGGYWGFSLPAPTTLDPLTSRALWSNAASGSATLAGGVMIPVGTNTRKLAAWLTEGKPPGALVSDQAILLGWRWGLNQVATANWDASWLQQSLNHFGQSGQWQPDANFEPSSCLGETTANHQSVPLIIPDSPQNQPNSNQESTQPRNTANSQQIKPETVKNQPSQPDWQPSTIATTSPSPWQQRDRMGVPLNIPQIDPEDQETPTTAPIALPTLNNMEQELAGLIARFETTLLTADAYHSSGNLSMGSENKQAINATADKSLNLVAVNSNELNHPSHQALATAKAGLAQFQNFVKNGQYAEAQSQWQATRDLLWQNYPSDRYIASPEMRAIWLDRGTIIQAKSEAGLTKLFDQFASAGINTVFIETVNASYPIYPSKVAPEQNPMLKGWDPLASAVKLAHARGIELHAWVWIFAAANQRHNTLLRQPANYTGPVLSRHPDWGIKDQNGNLFSPNTQKAFFDPANPEVRQYLLDLLAEIATNYEIDGIQLDYIRYPFQDPYHKSTYGYSNAAREQFFQQTGADLLEIKPNSPLWQKWQDIRIQNIDSFVTQASQLLRQKRPELLLSGAVFSFPRGERLLIIQQNWEEWLKKGELDLIFPMTYAPTTEELAQLTRGLFNQDKPHNIFILPGIRLLNLPDVVALDQLQFLRNLPTGGYALFAAENLNPNLQNFLSQTQSNGQTLKQEPLPYRQPFQAAIVRYQSLQKEWAFLIANKQLMMPETKLRDWTKQTDLVNTRFQSLTTELSERNLLLARVAFDDLESQFAVNMSQYQQEYPYQVQSWSNRLTIIQSLLDYGEQKLKNK